jgi:hypothetical protein
MNDATNQIILDDSNLVVIHGDMIILPTSGLNDAQWDAMIELFSDDDSDDE